MSITPGEQPFRKKRKRHYKSTAIVTVTDDTPVPMSCGTRITSQSAYRSSEQLDAPSVTAESSNFTNVEQAIPNQPNKPRKQGVSLHMNNLKERTRIFVDALTWSYANERVGQTCQICETSSAIFRCKCCRLSAFLCQDCLVKSHVHNPLHKVEKWNGTFFEPTTLNQCGLRISLGHEGNPCPHVLSSHDITVIHCTGIQTVNLAYCECLDSATQPEQLLVAGFWPATLKKVKTVFTIELLDDFHHHVLVSRKSALDYWTVLCRKTDNFFPERIPSYISQLSSATRFYRYVIALLHSGQAFGIDAHLKTDRRPGLIAMPCIACPEPGFNMPENWKDTPLHRAFIHRLFLHQDANFRNQLKSKTDKRDHEDTSLFEGHGFYPDAEHFKNYLHSVTNSDEKSECSNLKAVSLQNILKFKNMEVTGVMAVVCRHDCFRPGGQNDLQKGERYANADYALAGALSWVPVPSQVAHTYDIVCQYSKKLSERFDKHFPQLSHVVRKLHHAIPKKHIVGHLEECQIRWSCNHLPGFGRVYGEGIEAVWAEDNQQSSSLREMNAGHRHEVIEDNHMDWNIRKNQRMVRSTYRHFVEAIDEFMTSLLAYQAASEDLSSDIIAELRTKDVLPYQNSNGQWESVYQSQRSKFPSQAQIARQLLNSDLQISLQLNEKVSHLSQQSLVRFIQTGIQLQVAQYDLRMKTNLVPDNPDSREHQDLKNQRLKLSVNLRRWAKELSMRFPSVLQDDDFEMLASDDPENATIGLPSDFSSAQRQRLGLASAADIETQLRRGQANDSLESLRDDIRTEVTAQSQRKKHAFGTGSTTRASTLVQRIQRKKARSADLYIMARQALLSLNAFENDPEMGKVYLPLNKSSDLWMKDPTRILNIGDSRRTEPWIWHHGVPANNGSDEWNDEVSRVRWFKTRAVAERWREEILLRDADFDRIHRGYDRLVQAWNSIATSMTSGNDIGKQAYCHKISHYYQRRVSECRDSWNEARAYLKSTGIEVHVLL